MYCYRTCKFAVNANNFVQSENILVSTITCLQRFSATCRTGTYDVLASHCRAELGYNVRTHLQLIEHHNWPGCEDKRDLQHGVRLQARQPAGPYDWFVQVQMKNPLPFFSLFQYDYMELIFRKMKHKIELENKYKQHVCKLILQRLQLLSELPLSRHLQQVSTSSRPHSEPTCK